MKKLLLIAALCLPLFAAAQSDTSKNKAKEQYCMVVATGRMLSTKVDITVDFGQETKIFSFQDTRLKDEQGKVIKFNSVIDALNYMAQQGWEFVNAYPLSEGSGGGKVLNYVLKRKL
jgi:hypothetical protein